MNGFNEETLKSLSTTTSFDRGVALFHEGAIYSTFIQDQQLSGKCIGSSESFYQQIVHLVGDVITSAFCTCPYDWGGLCKHIIALLLTFIHEPYVFIDVNDIKAQLFQLEQETLVNILIQFVNLKPDGYEWLHKNIKDFTSKTISSQSHHEGKTQISKSLYKMRINNILDSLDEVGMSDDYWLMSDVVEALEEIQDTATGFLDVNNAQVALQILVTLFSEVTGRYEEFDDPDGMLADFLFELAYPMVEAILCSDLQESEMVAYCQQLDPSLKMLRLYGVDGLGVIPYVLQKGWAEEPFVDASEADNFDETIRVEAKLNIFDRQDRFEEYLAYSLEKGEFVRHILMQIRSENFEKAIRVAHHSLKKADEILQVARALEEAGLLNDAIRLAEKGMCLEDDYPQLGVWLGGVQESQGQLDGAINAYRAAFDTRPTYHLYTKLKALYGDSWDSIKDDLIKALEVSSDQSVMLDVYLSEAEWDCAILIASGVGKWDYHLIEKVADKVLPYHPDWVIQVSQEQAEILIQKSTRNYYRIAARWLAKAKKAYLFSGKETEWLSYLAGLRSTYHRRYALLSELGVLDHG